MITVSDVVQGILSRSYRPTVSVESWYDGEFVAQIPVADATEEGDRTLNVPERLTLTVPRLADGVDWSPSGAADHPLAANGQRLHVTLGVGTTTGSTETFARGRFLIEESTVDGDRIDVTAVGLLELVAEARLITPLQPSGTLGSTLRSLIEPAITVNLDAAPTDRSVPSGLNFSDDRLESVNQLLDAWAAEAVVTADGYLAVIPAVQSATSVLTLTDGTGGTVVQATGSSTRDGFFNAVLAKGTDTSGGEVQAVAYDQTSPRAYGGPASPLLVPFEYFSPLLTTVAQCLAAAQTILARKMRESMPRFTVEAVPNPTLQLGDVLQLNSDAFTGLCAVEKLTLPYVPNGQPMMLTVRSLT